MMKTRQMTIAITKIKLNNKRCLLLIMSGVDIKTLEASNDGFGSPIEADWSKSFQEAMQKTELGGGGESNPSERPDAKELLKQYQQQPQQPQQQPQQQRQQQQQQQQHQQQQQQQQQQIEYQQPYQEERHVQFMEPSVPSQPSEGIDAMFKSSSGFSMTTAAIILAVGLLMGFLMSSRRPVILSGPRM